MMHDYDPENNWRELPKTYADKQYITGITYEFLHVPTNKIYKRNTLSTQEFGDVTIHYGEYKGRLGYPDKIEYPVDELRWRWVDKPYKAFLRALETVQVGDFVKCVGTRSGRWNRVDTINYDRETVFGPKYDKPDGKMAYEASENSISKIRNIVRNGVEIL